jgi:hypothetical protein
MKKLTLAFVVLVLFTLGSITADGEEMLVNGDFETVDDSVGLINGIRLDHLGTDGWDVYDSIPGWRTTAGNGIEVQYDFAVGAAHSASRKVELDSHPGDGSNSSMTQTVYLIPGSYELSYFYRARTSTEDDNRIDVFLDSESVGFPPANKIMTSNSSDPGLGNSHSNFPSRVLQPDLRCWRH